MQPSTIEVAATGSPEEIDAIMHQLAQAIPAAEVRPVRQIMEGEARVLGKTRVDPAGRRGADYFDGGAVRALDADGLGV